LVPLGAVIAVVKAALSIGLGLTYQQHGHHWLGRCCLCSEQRREFIESGLGFAGGD
jgi:hypothetical protein